MYAQARVCTPVRLCASRLFGQNDRQLTLSVQTDWRGRCGTGRDRAKLAAGTIHVRCVCKIRLERVSDAVPNGRVRTALLTQIDGRNRDAFTVASAAVSVLVQYRVTLCGVRLKPHLAKRVPVLDAGRTTVVSRRLAVSAHGAVEHRTERTGRTRRRASLTGLSYGCGPRETFGESTSDVHAVAAARRPHVARPRVARPRAARSTAAPPRA